MLKRKKKKEGITKASLVTAILLAAIASILFFLSIWAFKTWTGLTMDEIIFHLNAPLEGTGDGMIQSGFINTLLPASIVIAADIIIFAIFRKKKNFRRFISVQKILSVVLIAVTFAFSWNKLALGSYIGNQLNVSSYIEDHYKDPAKTKITFPSKKRNLIYIYLEAMEDTYSDTKNGGAFTRNTIPELTKLSEENQNFSGTKDTLNGGYVMPGGTYTMAAIFSQSTGLPMKVNLGDDFTDTRGSFNNMDTQSSFFPGVTSLGDVLEDQGYKQVFMLGSDANFGGRKLFFTGHGDYEIDDYNWAIEKGLIPSDYYVFWGYEDQKLFANAKNRLTELAKSDQPFNFTMLTVDTHFEDGYVCNLCGNEFGSNQYANVMACSSRQVTEFVKWIQKQDFYDNTTIVISGDHLTMDSDFCNDVPSDYERKVYTTYINPAAQPELAAKREYTTLDNFPTTLGALGCKIEGNRLGLGTNLFSSEKTLVEQEGYSELYKNIEKRSKFVEKLANINVYNQSLMQKKGLTPSSLITVDSFSSESKNMQISVSDIQNVFGKIASVKATLTDSSGKSVTASTDKETDDSYKMSLDLSGIDYTDSTLSVQAVGKNGKSSDIGQATGDMSIKSTNVNTYLGQLAKHPEYCILLAVRDDASRLLTQPIDDGLKNLGFKKSLIDHFRWSYYGVKAPDGLLGEDLSEEEISQNGSLPDGTPYAIISQGGNSGAGGAAGRYLTCSIKLNDIQYAVKKIGLNFVIYDPDSHKVVDSVCFNTNDKYTCTRADIAQIEKAAAQQETKESDTEETN